MIHKARLSNGVRIITKEIPHIQSVSMGVWVNAGARDEAPDENGLSHFIEHMIFKGTAKRSAYQIAKEFDAVGGHTNAFTSMETTCYHAKVMRDHLVTMVDILSDIFLNSVFDPVEIHREQPVIFQEIGMLEDTPEEFIHVLSGNTFWGESPLGRSILGTRENLLRFDSHVVQTFFQKLYQPDRILICTAGNTEHDRILELMGPAFEAISPGDDLPDRATPVGNAQVRPFRKKMEQVHLCIGTPGLSLTDPKRFAFSLLNTLLGGNMSSRLFQEIRERRGLAYSVYSFISAYDDAGMFGAYAACDAKKIKEVVALILEEMHRIKTHPVEGMELKNAKEFLKGGLYLSSESVDNQMVRLAQNEILFNRAIPLGEIIQGIESVTADEIRDLAAELFHSDRLAVTLLGPISTRMNLKGLLSL
ncbi:MAG: peptidase M16 [Desulfobacterales bacterium CG23_combo_of_CG06-09_8_20_14_all_52_9]|nr:MAG: peptidase M16 [Desulfobacterales bacterium CG23_combo_of_CG06-09_8_20_14_all_52_9]